MTCMFPGTVWTLPFKFFSKRGLGHGHMTPKFLGNANSSKTVKDTKFKFDKPVLRDPLKLLFCKNSLGGDMHSHEHLLVVIIIIIIIIISCGLLVQ